MVERDKVPFGYIYRATNVLNDKVYIGKTETGSWKDGKIPIEERWKREVKEAYNRKAREENLRYIENAIIKYGAENFKLTQEDVASNLEELNEKEKEYIKENDSMNPDKGYNMMEGGEGGRMSEMAKGKMSISGSEKWGTDPEYREKHLKERQERALKNPEWQQKMTEINQEMARNPKVQEKMSKVLTEKWQEQKYQESVSKGMKEKWKDEKFRERQARAKTEGKREIPDKAEFLNDITEMTKKDIIAKYDMDGKSINNRIEEMLKHQDVRTYSEAKKFLEDKNIQEVLKDIEERQGMEQKPDFREKMTEINRARAKDPQWLAKMREINEQYRKEIPDKREFIKEIKENMPKKEMLQKYDMGGKTLNRRVQEMFGPDGPKNYTELKEHLQDKNINDVLKEIEERTKEKDGKPSTQGESKQDKGESKSQDNLKEKTERDTKSDVKENLKETPEEEIEGDTLDKSKENPERNLNQETSDENLREKEEESAEIEENIESKNEETLDKDMARKEEENNISDSEENMSKGSSNSEEEAKYGKNVENMAVKDYAGIDKNSSKRAQDITCLDENQDSKNLGQIKYIDLDVEDLESITTVKDIKADEEKDYKAVNEGVKREIPDYAFIDNFLDKTKEVNESKSDKRNERGRDYRHT